MYPFVKNSPTNHMFPMMNYLVSHVLTIGRYVIMCSFDIASYALLTRMITRRIYSYSWRCTRRCNCWEIQGPFQSYRFQERLHNSKTLSLKISSWRIITHIHLSRWRWQSKWHNLFKLCNELLRRSTWMS